MSSVLDGARWRKSSRSGNDTAQCVELALGGRVVGVRDSKDPGTVLLFSAGAVEEFLAGVREGDFDRPNGRCR